MWTKGRCRLQRVAQRYKGGEAGNEGLLATRTPRACRGLLLPTPPEAIPQGRGAGGARLAGTPAQGCLRASSEARAGAETAPSEARPWMWRQI